MPIKEKNSTVALYISFFFPSFGHFYIGQFRKGAFLALTLITAAILYFYTDFHLVSAILSVSAWIFATFDSYAAAEDTHLPQS